MQKLHLHRLHIGLGIMLCISQVLNATAPCGGVDSISSNWMRECYQWGELRHYLDNQNDYVTYQTETTGEWGTSEAYIFSVSGNSYKWNRYYLDGFRIDSRFEPGSMDYQLNMREHSLNLDYHKGNLWLERDTVRFQRVSVSGNVGNIGGYGPGTLPLLELFHTSGVDRTYNKEAITNREHTIGATTAEAVFGIPYKEGTLYEHVVGSYGKRRHLTFDNKGLSGNYDADYYQVQMDGALPTGGVLDDLQYILSAKKRSDLYSEYWYNNNEVAQQLRHSVSLYGKKATPQMGNLTTGLTYAVNRVEHVDETFTRNLADQDGEGMEPWYVNGRTHEVNWALGYEYSFYPWLRVKVDGYNSLMHFSPTSKQWSNQAELQTLDMMSSIPMYRYEWESRAFTAGMLENSVQLEAGYRVLPWMYLSGMVGVALDGILLRDKQVVTPSWEAKLDVNMQATKWLRIEFILANYRARYSWDQVQYLSSDYLSGKVYYSGTETLLSTTGGTYHQVSKNLKQPQYAVLDLPIVMTFGRHEVSIMSSLKKYYNTWTTRMAPGYEDSFEGKTILGRWSDVYDVYREKNGEKYYRVEMLGPVGNNWLMNSPLYFSNLIKYTYNGQKVFVSFSWQSYGESGIAALGNGVQSNDVMPLSETTASPNVTIVDANMGQQDNATRWLGRLDQDRAFIARLQVGANITPNWQLSLTGKFRDGTPFTHYHTELASDEYGNQQAIIYRSFTRGDNVVDGNFGQRKDSYFNFDLRLRYRGLIHKVPFCAEAVCYNIWDFATELNEYCFEANPGVGIYATDNRYALSLCVPRGLYLKVSVGLEKQD